MSPCRSLLVALGSGLLASPATPQAEGFRVPAGFVATRVTATDHSYLALAFDTAGRMVLSSEREGLLLAEDEDGDGFFEEVRTLTGELTAAQGLAVVGSTLYVVGRRRRERGAVESGLWRAQLAEGGRAVESLRKLVPIEDDDEHGAHGVVLGPDGALYVALGDHARFATPAENAQAFPEDLAAPLPPIPDPSGFGRRLQLHQRLDMTVWFANLRMRPLPGR